MNYSVDAGDWSTQANPGLVLQFNKTTCTSLNVEIGVAGDRSESGSVELVQSNSSPQIVTVPYNTIVNHVFTFDGGPWQLNSWNQYGDGPTAVYLDGSATCYSLSGK
jgi:hypothetical protein